MRTRIIPVIHHADDAQAMRNAERAFEADCDGVLLIHMEGRNDLLPTVAAAIKARWPDRIVGMNLLGFDPVEALDAVAACGLDATWTDEQVTYTEAARGEAERVAEALRRAPAGHLLFAGVAFKHQRREPDPAAAARRAVELGMIPTTSGPATGVAAGVEDVASLRAALGPDAPLAIASGVTPANARLFAPLLSHVLVATGVSSSFHEFDPAALRALRRSCDAA